MAKQRDGKQGRPREPVRAAPVPASAADGQALLWQSVSESGAELRFQDFLTFKLGRVHSLINRVVTPGYLDGSGLTLPEWRLLARLGAYPSLEMRRLTRINLMDKAAISRATDSLVEKGYVGRYVDPQHATRRIVAVTPAGKRVLRKIMPAAQREQAVLLRLLSPEERLVFETVLARLTDELLRRGAIDLSIPDTNPARRALRVSPAPLRGNGARSDPAPATAPSFRGG